MRLALISIFIFLTSCAGAKYGVDIGGGQSTYTQRANGQTFGLNEGETMMMGLTQETEYTITRFYFSIDSTYPEVFVQGSNVEMRTSGYEGSFGIKLAWVQPRLVLGKSNYKMTTNGITTSDDILMYGYGVAVEIPIYDKFYIWGSYDIIDNGESARDLSSVNEEVFRTAGCVRYNFYINE
jgi:hypothetical protein